MANAVSGINTCLALSINSVSNSLILLVKQASSLLESISDSAVLDAQILLAFTLDKERTYLLTWPERQLTAEQFQLFDCLLARRIQGEPIAYIIGMKEFWSLPLFVSPATLIPRPDTEILVEQVLAQFEPEQNKVVRCLDLGTGTGAIALALASEMPLWLFDAVDYSEAAVALAGKNAQHLAITNVNIYRSDWFSNIQAEQKFDLIVANPPYIDEQDLNLQQGDVRFEPASALVAEQNGFADIIHIASQARSYLTDHGMLFIEHGFQQGMQIRKLLTDLSYQEIQTVKDLSGHERVTKACFAGI